MALFEIENLEFCYPQADWPALSNLSFSVEPGEFVLICGKSGCGKTTLMRHFKTVMTPYGRRSGEIYYCGRPLADVPVREQAGDIGYVLQNPDNQLVTDKVWHELAFGVENLGCPQEIIRLRVAEMASFFGIQNWFYKDVDELSGGQKQLLNLAAVMAMHPKVLVLDEPTSQLDPIAAGDFLATIRKINLELGVTIIMIEHRLEEVFPMADKVLVLADGKKAFFDTPGVVGKSLLGNDLFLALPSPVQIYNGAGQMGECPLTVCEGRNWLEANFKPTEAKKKGKRSQSAPTEELRHGKEKPVIEARQLWFRYEREAPDVVKGLSMKVYSQELFCILGGNGTGKSTALSLISGIRKPYRGRVLLKGRDAVKIQDKELFHRFLGVLPQNPQNLFAAETVLEDLEEIFADLPLSDKKTKDERIRRVVDETEIGHLLRMHPYDLSGGEQQRAALAKVLLLEPQILLLDEPTKGLDGFYKAKLAGIFERLKKKGMTILMVSHDIEFCAAYADRCALFFDGNIVTACETHRFFVGNSFYTTAANRMARHIFPDAVTVKDVIELCKTSRQQA